MHGGPVVRLPAKVHDRCIAEAHAHYPSETGGTLMGYRADANVFVVTAEIGAGPEASRGPHSFEPNQAWQLAEIARHYEASGRREAYLGDWHSHPGAEIGRLSRTDRRVLRRIINTPSARAPTPLMLIFYGTRDEWRASAWIAALIPRLILWPRLQLSNARLRLY
jgi:integrative and conjugative element protein (TIGR02256 family)